MKPTFALDLTREAIGLLHRTPKGWLHIGEVAFDAPDLDEALDYLRKTALGLSPMGVATKVVLPASQVLYTEIHAPGPSRDDKRKQIAAALEGKTPYDVADLVFDWSGKGATVKVAVVARETLAEAEGFAVQHRFNPVSVVAIPEDGAFVGEPWFGPTEASLNILAHGESVDRDREAVTVLHRELPVAEPAAAAEPEAAETPEPVETTSVSETDDSLPGLEEALNAVLPDPVGTTAFPAPEPLLAEIEEVEEIEEELPGAMVAALETAPVEAPVEEETSPNESVSVETPALETEVAEPVAASVFAPLEPEVEEAPFAHVTDTAAFPETEDDLPPATRKLVIEDLDGDIPPAPPNAAMMAFASRRAAGGSGPIPRPVDGSTRAAAAIVEAPAAARVTAPPRSTPPKTFPGLVTAPSIPGTRAKPKGKVMGGEIARPAGLGPTTVKSPARPGGTFGAAAPPRRRTGVVFMVLVALLLLFLALIGLWSSLYLSRSDVSSAETAPTDSIVADTEVVPGVDDEMLADMQDPEGMTDPIPEAEGAALAEADAAALATEEQPVNLATEEPADAPVDTDVAVAEPAPETAVTTDLAAGQAPVEDQDEIFLSAMDAPPPALDALALPAPPVVLDTAPDAPMPPPAFGTVYQFDANGLLKPTPEGILSPDGVMLIAGPPPLVPPARSEVATAAALAAAAVAPVAAAPEAATTSPADASLVTAGATPEAAETVEPTPSDPAMAEFRPRPRPEGLVPATAGDDAQLATDAAAEFAGFRPLPRPDSVLAAASASRPADAADLGAQGASLTAQAEAQLAEAAALEASNPSIVAISMRPAARPRDLSRAVEAAVAAAVREPEPQPEAEVVAAAAPAPDLKPEELDEVNEPDTTAAAPKIPTKASVAKQATYVNAINLSKVNLIGTYGTDSKRYALIRQSNGRYKKVKVGDKIEGGTIKAITETEVRYQKGGKLLSLKMPKA